VAPGGGPEEAAETETIAEAEVETEAAVAAAEEEATRGRTGEGGGAGLGSGRWVGLLGDGVALAGRVESRGKENGPRPQL